MSEPDWRYSRDIEPTASPQWQAHAMHAEAQREFPMAAESRAPSRGSSGDPLDEVWDYLGKH